LPTLRERRPGSHPDRAVWFILLDPGKIPHALTYLGSGQRSQAEARLVARCGNYSGWIQVSWAVEGEWRWKHDRAAYEKEVRREQDGFRARRADARAQQKSRLEALTWDTLLKEKPFRAWRAPTPSARFIAAARTRMHDAIRALQALGAKPKRAQVRAILKACVEWFNAKDVEFGGVIETDEREDIYAAFEELTVVARQRALLSEMDAWRSW